jgi:serine protease SohB
MVQSLRQLAARASAAALWCLPRRWRRDSAVVPVVRLSGVVGIATPLRGALSIGAVAKTLERAFAVRNAKAVALAINSPGGSAVQSHLIFRRIRDLAEEKQIPVIAFVEDVAASGGYMIACAADEIVCDPSSIVGSIGVIGASFGFPDAMKRLGIERRVYTAGESKSMLDPFLPEKDEDVQRLKAIQQDIHDLFIDLVRSRRGDRLSGPEKTMFSGEYWVAKTAKDFGLIDQLGDLRSVLRQRFGEKVAMPLIAAERTLFGRRLPGVADMWPDRVLEIDKFGLIEDAIAALESRAIWARFGL